MPLTPGARLGPYEVTAQIGVGGMGEVYRATDTNLKRQVAIKVLPASVAGDTDRLARFQREAEVLAALNHPHIAAIYGLEKTPEFTALVMELVEGDDLSQRIARLRAPGASARQAGMPLNEALPIAKQIAEALEAAHEQGIIHRDLKPANIKVRPDGTVKVLDFGLAKALGQEAGSRQYAVGSETPSMAPTITSPALPFDYRSGHPEQGRGVMTGAGMILGTAAYMSPEQARGKTVDKRADVWAFGAVLYEMLTGRRAFAGDDVSDVLASVLAREPDWTVLAVTTPSAIRRLLRRCLDKDPRRRLQTLGEARIQLEDVLSGASEDVANSAAASVAVQSRARPWVAIGVAATLAAAVTAAAMWTLRSGAPATNAAIARVTVALPAGDELGLALGAATDGPALALSPDGATLVYVGRHDNTQSLFVRTLDSLDAKALAGTEGAVQPFFSPDGQWVGFFAQGKLKKAAVAGGAVQILADATGPRGGAWGPDDTIYFVPLANAISGIWKVSAAGGTASEVTRLDRAGGEISHRWPQVLPGGQALQFTVWTGPGAGEKRVDVQILQTGERRVLAQGADTGRYVSTGHLVYANQRADTLVAVPMNLDRFEVASTAPAVLAEQVRVGGEGAVYAVSDAGHLVYARGGAERLDNRLAWVDRRGTVQTLAVPTRQYRDVVLSPDGRLAAIGTSGNAYEEIWIYDFARSTLTRLSAGGSSQAPVWAPDGAHVAYRATRSGSRNLFWKSVNNPSPEERLTTGDGTDTPSSFSPDGKLLAFARTDQATGSDIWVVPLDGDRTPRGVVVAEGDQRMPQFSPDGRSLAYMSTESGRGEVYVQPFPGPGRKWLVSTDGGTEPRWSRNGRELFYRNGDAFMAVEVKTQPAFSAGSPRRLFQTRGVISGTATTGFDVSLDGQRFLMVEPVASQPPVTQIEVVMNWFTELTRLVPTR